ncbi:ciMsi protein isoform X1 [Ciona intestinalis]
MSQNDAEEAGKIFVGGLARQTTLEGLRSYFENYGEVSDCVLMKDKETGFSRGFGFVTFTNPSSVTAVVKARPHNLDNKMIDPKPCTTKAAQQQKKVSSTNYSKAHKIFVGGISMEASEADVQGYFERYGTVVEVVFVVNKEDTSKPHKGFGFVTFEDESSVDQAIAKHYHIIKDKRVEAKKAESRDKMGGGRNDQQQGYGMGYGQGNNMMYNQGMNPAGGNWMGGGQNMMGNYGYGNQNFPTAYPQQQGYGGNQGYGYGYGYGGNMGGNMPGQMGGMQGGQMGGMPNQMGGNMQGGQMGGNMQGGYQQGMMGMQGGGVNNGNGAQPNAASTYPQNPTSYGPMPTSGGGYNQGNTGSNNSSGPANTGNTGGGTYGQKSGGGGGSNNSGYHPYRR